MEQQEIVYISGPIAGNMENYQAEFDAAAQAVTSAGHIPLNPATLPLGLEQRDYMRICVAMLEAADLVLQLDGWDTSAGALAEYAYAKKIGIPRQDLYSYLREHDQGKAPEPERTPPMSRTERLFGKRETWAIPYGTQDPARPEGYKGFLLIRCPDCGEVRGFCTKKPITEHTCQNCGANIPLEDLIPAHVNCGKCSSHFKYMTNIDTQEPVPFRCLECEAPVDLQMNGKGTALTTIGFRRPGVTDNAFSFRKAPRTGWSGDRHGSK